MVVEGEVLEIDLSHEYVVHDTRIRISRVSLSPFGATFTWPPTCQAASKGCRATAMMLRCSALGGTRAWFLRFEALSPFRSCFYRQHKRKALHLDAFLSMWVPRNGGDRLFGL